MGISQGSDLSTKTRKTLKETMESMETRHNLKSRYVIPLACAMQTSLTDSIQYSQRTRKSKIKEWNLPKNLPATEMTFIADDSASIASITSGGIASTSNH